MAFNNPTANTPLAFENAKTVMGWNDIDRQVDAIMAILRVHHYQQPITNIVGISRGGLIPAVMLAHRLELPLIDVIQARSYSTKGVTQLSEIKINVPDNVLQVLALPTTLIVDDIIDSGRTFDVLKYYAPNAIFAALITKRSTTHIYGAHYAPDQWIVFPWETS